jgi:hypothetical protein
MYLRQVWEMSGFLYDSQYGFRQEYSCERQLVTFCQDIAYSLDESFRTATITIDFSKVFDLVPNDKLLTKIAATGVGFRVVIRVKLFLSTFEEG